MSEATLTPPAQTMGSSKPSSSGEINASTMMGSTATIPAPKPAAPAAPAAPKPAAAVRAPLTGEPAIKVIDDGKKPSEKMFQNLRNLADKGDKEVRDKQASLENSPVDDAGEEGEDGENIARAPQKTEDGKPVAHEKKPKVNPWKVIDEHKAARAKLESEIAELKKGAPNMEELKVERDRLAAIAKRNEELEETIKFVDYSKSKEFTENYQKPYEEAWSRAMSELKELTVVDETGEEREMAPSDLLELVNLPLMKARERAEEMYGASANEVMVYRKEIKGLYEKQAQALEQARKAGVEKSQIEQTQRTEHMKSLQQEVAKTWEQVNEQHMANEKVGHYFKPVEGNDEINTRLETGFKFVDETAKMNVWDPNLTAEQRKVALERHAAVRARAAGWSRMRYEAETARAELKAALEKLAQYEKSTPEFGGDTRESGATAAGGSKMPGLMQRLAARAK